MSNRDAAELHREIEQLRAELEHVVACSQNRDEENARLRSELAGVTAENKALQDQLDCACNPEELRIAREDMQRLQAALARADSAAPKSHPNSSEIRTSAESATPDHLRGAAEMARRCKQGGAA